jgi:FAD/FMN-containing dehydrogenase/Fe-S oxidoreductase
MATVNLQTPTHRTAERLAEVLRQRLRGEVRFDGGSRALYSTDASNYRQVPVGVVVPRDLDDVVAAVAACREFDAPVVSRGGGTSLGGQCTNTAVVLDFSKYVNRVESVDVANRTAIVQAGAVLDAVNRAGRSAGGLVFGPKPATHDHCTIGGMVGNNSCGSTAQWSGTTASNVRRLEVLTYDGERMWVGPTSPEAYESILAGGGRRADIYERAHDLADRYAEQIRSRYPRIPRRISGYNLPDLLPENGFNLARALVGSESTCVVVLRAELALLPEPTHVCLLMVGYPDIATAAAHIPTANAHQPYVLEGVDHKLIGYELRRRMNPVAIHKIPDAGAWLAVKTMGDTAEQARAASKQVLAALRADGDVTVDRLYDQADQIDEMDSVREAALGATARVPGMRDTWPGWEDSAVPPDQLASYLRDLQDLMGRYGLEAASLYGHFGHGCVHTSLPFELSTVEGVAGFRSFVTEAAHLVVRHGGSLSGEHGDGQARGELLSIMFGDEIVAAMAEFKSIFDPGDRMNPGKVVAANPLDQQLRLGPEYRPAAVDTFFEYPADGGFEGVPTRCFGVGACRRQDSESGGVMCPSYMVTRDEQHSTRGRMRLLFEMMRGQTITDGWRSQDVHDALDLCLACKGCKSDCPVTVDMATYKAEFLAHHYERRIRPRSHYSLGWLPLWARLASLAPGLANASVHAPATARMAARIAGIDPDRELPSFAPVPFTTAFRHRRHQPGAGERGEVLLWPDTFTNYFAPHIATSAVIALEAAGFTVRTPDRPVCCGLTWISTGQLGIARRVLGHSLRVLAPYLERGTPVLGLEPSCTSVLRSDAVDLLPEAVLKELARRAAEQTVTFAELLDRRAPEFAPRLAGGGRHPKAIVQTHCHQHATLGMQADERLMRRIGLDPEFLSSGCCGLAGDFGLTSDHREVSLGCAERALYPAIRAADVRTLVLADGFSCRLQIASDYSGRRGVHLAEVVAAAVRGQPVDNRPEHVIAPIEREPALAR